MWGSQLPLPLPCRRRLHVLHNQSCSELPPQISCNDLDDWKLDLSDSPPGKTRESDHTW